MSPLFVSVAVVAVLLWTRPAPRCILPRQNPSIPSWAAASGLGPAVLALATRSVSVLVIGSGVMVFARLALRRRSDRQSASELDAELVVFVEEASQRLRSGAMLGSAFQEGVKAYPVVGLAFGGVIGAMRGGVRLETALDEELDPDAGPSVRLVAAAIVVLVAKGGPAASALDRVGDTLRANVAARAELEAQSTQAVASALVLAALPVFFTVGLAIVDPAAAEFYLHTLPGLICLVTMFGLLAVGWYWIETLIWNRQ